MGMEEKIKAGTLNAADWLQILRCSEWDDILRQTADQLRRAIRSAFGRLYYRVGKTQHLQMLGFAAWFLRYGNAFQTVL